MLDIDDLCRREGENWAFSGTSFLYPDYERCMVYLSRGGTDASEMREFDLRKKEFVHDGFFVPEAKGGATWIDKDTLLLYSDFGEGTKTKSGYPRIIKTWRRGTPLLEAETLLEGNEKDFIVWGFVHNTHERQYIIIKRMFSFFKSILFILENNGLVRIEIPEDAEFHGFYKKQMLVELRSDWNTGRKTYKEASLISIDYDKFLKGSRDFDVIYQPKERTSLLSVSITQNFLIIHKLVNIRSELQKYFLVDGKWHNKKIETADGGTVSVISANAVSDQFFFTYEDFLTPAALFHVSDDGVKIQKVKALPDFFDSSKYEAKQYETKSSDGTNIPYFIVYSKGMQCDGSNPALLTGYGGFEVSRRPYYSATIGCAWLENGGVYVLANIRGGGEFGPKWHKAALKQNRQRAYDDFLAVSEDLIKRKITSQEHLGIMGGSNGGLLVGVAFTQRPNLYKAVVCSNPLLDMKRYSKLLAGASWMAEYGDPDIPEEWEYIKKYSPYHNLFESKKYPKVFFTTTSRDDRVHPGHARKMAARMEELGHQYYYFENIEGGHGAGVTNKQRALMLSLEFTYLLKMLKK